MASIEFNSSGYLHSSSAETVTKNTPASAEYPPIAHESISRDLKKEDDSKLRLLASLVDEIDEVKAKESTPQSASHTSMTTPVLLPSVSKCTTSTAVANTANINFPSKLALLLAETQLNSIVSWIPSGLGWKIHDMNAFLSSVLPLYFQSDAQAFVHDLRVWGFRRGTSGIDSGVYFHDLFQRDAPHLMVLLQPNSTTAPFLGPAALTTAHQSLSPHIRLFPMIHNNHTIDHHELQGGLDLARALAQSITGNNMFETSRVSARDSHSGKYLPPTKKKTTAKRPVKKWLPQLGPPNPRPPFGTSSATFSATPTVNSPPKLRPPLPFPGTPGTF